MAKSNTHWFYLTWCNVHLFDYMWSTMNGPTMNRRKLRTARVNVDIPWLHRISPHIAATNIFPIRCEHIKSVHSRTPMSGWLLYLCRYIYSCIVKRGGHNENKRNTCTRCRSHSPNGHEENSCDGVFIRSCVFGTAARTLYWWPCGGVLNYEKAGKFLTNE